MYMYTYIYMHSQIHDKIYDDDTSISLAFLFALKSWLIETFIIMFVKVEDSAWSDAWRVQSAIHRALLSNWNDISLHVVFAQGILEFKKKKLLEGLKNVKIGSGVIWLIP